MKDYNAQTINDLLEYAFKLKMDQMMGLKYKDKHINSYKNSVTRVFSEAYPSNWETITMAEVDIDDAIRRINEAYPNKYKKNTLQQYRWDIIHLMGWFSEYCKDPNWTPKPTRIFKSGTSILYKPDADLKKRMIVFPVLLSNGIVASIQLPIQIEQSDYERIMEMIHSLVRKENEEAVQ